MRYFAHDGSTTHGPASVEDLTARPWFDGDVLVCPVGATDSADWKPALSYPAFKQALLAPASKPAAAPLPPPPPAPAPAPALAPCPRCAAGNPAKARFCNECGQRLDGTSPLRPEDAPKPIDAPEPSPSPSPAALLATPDPSPEPSLRPMAVPPARVEPARPMARPPERVGPMAKGLSPTPPLETAQEPALPPTEAAHSFESLSSAMPHPMEPESSLPPDTAPLPPAEAPAAPAKRKTAVLAALGAAALGAAAWLLLARPSPEPAPAPAGADLTMPAPAAPAAATAEPSPAALASAPPPAAAPARPRPRAPRAQGSPAPLADRPARPRRRRRAAPSPPPADAADAVLIESRVAAEGPAVPGQPAEPAGAKPLSDPDEALEDFLPGIPRRKPLKAGAAAKPAPAPAAASPTAPAPSEATPANAEGDVIALQQAVEEFEFCSQLLAQGAFADHFDTCLCKETRAKPPYRNRRGFYASALKKEAAEGRLETQAQVLSTRMENGVARIVARWKTRPDDPGREVDEAWIMDDGLWCKAP